LCVAVRVAVYVAVFVEDFAALEGFICVAHPDCSVIGLDSCVAVRCSALQCVAVFCSVLQCVTVCCNVLQCAALGTWYT